MFMKSEKKKNHAMLVVGIGAMALYGAYSAVCGMKNMCCKKAEMLTKVFKKSNKCSKNDNCECASEEA